MPPLEELDTFVIQTTAIYFSLKCEANLVVLMAAGLLFSIYMVQFRYPKTFLVAANSQFRPFMSVRLLQFLL